MRDYTRIYSSLNSIFKILYSVLFIVLSFCLFSIKFKKNKVWLRVYIHTRNQNFILFEFYWKETKLRTINKTEYRIQKI